MSAYCTANSGSAGRMRTSAFGMTNLSLIHSGPGGGNLPEGGRGLSERQVGKVGGARHENTFHTALYMSEVSVAVS